MKHDHGLKSAERTMNPTLLRVHTNKIDKKRFMDDNAVHSKNEDKSVLRLLTNKRSPARRKKISDELKNP